MKLNKKSTTPTALYAFARLLARERTNEDLACELNKLAPQADEIELVSLAERHRVSPMLYHRLRESGQAITAQWMVLTVETLRQAHYANRLHILAQRRDLYHLVTDLRTIGVRSLLLKGLAIEALVYPAEDVRAAGDIDLLIEESHLDAVVTTLVEHGYRPLKPDFHVKKEDLHFYRRVFHHFSYECPASKCQLELHWRLSHQLDLDDLINNCFVDHPAIEIHAEVGVGALSKVQQVIYLAVHGAFHAWARLKWLLDIHFCLEGLDEQDASQIMLLAQKMRLERIVLFSACLSAELFGSRLPGNWVELARNVPHIDRQMAHCIDAMLREQPHWQQSDFGWDIKELVYRLSLVKSMRYKAGVVGRSIIGPSDLLGAYRSRWSLWIFPFVRAKRFVSRR